MTFDGHVKGGIVVFDQPIVIAEGTRVRVEIVPEHSEDDPETIPTLAERLAPFIGQAKSLPADAAEKPLSLYS